MRDCADQPPGLGFRISSDFQRSHSRNHQTIKRPGNQVFDLWQAVPRREERTTRGITAHVRTPLPMQREQPPFCLRPDWKR